MSEVFEGYERRYCELSASLAKKCTSASLLDGEQKKQKVTEVKVGLDEAETLIRKMDLEGRSLQPNVKAVLLVKLREYKSDLSNLKSEVKRITSTNLNVDARDALESGMADALTGSADQSARLIMSTERLDKSSDHVRESRRTMLETEELGVSLLQDLHQQRQSLLHGDNTWMEVVLEESDAGDWIYRGEGAANLVLAYVGSSPMFIGKVLRVQKAPIDGSPRYGSDSDDCHSALTVEECHLWNDIEGLASARTMEIAEQLYVQHVITPLLGSRHVDAGIRFDVSKEFLESVEKNVMCQRPSLRVDAAKVNTLCNSALLISDHSVLHCGKHKGEFCISVEIKPKCGFLPVSRYISGANSLKKSITRFKMHQALKLKHGEISEISKYDPLDLFSESSKRVHRAIKALFLTPQNNFRVFLNGSLIFGGSGGGTDGTTCVTSNAFEDVLKCVIRAEDGLRIQNFIHLVAEAALGSGLLDRLLKVQKLDTLDIEGAIHTYYDVVSQPCEACNDIGDHELRERYRDLHSLRKDESLKIVREYLIAATAKDLSMIIGFRPRDNEFVESPYNSVVLESTNQTFDYKGSFIDFDMKPLKKMEHYYKLDQKIVGCYAKMANGDHQVENGGSCKTYNLA